MRKKAFLYWTIIVSMADVPFTAMTPTSHCLHRLTQHPGKVVDVLHGQARISLHVKKSTKDVNSYLGLCDGITKYFDSKLDIFHVNYHNDDTVHDDYQQLRYGNDITNSQSTQGDYPAFSIVVFLRFFGPDDKSGDPLRARKTEACAFKEVLSKEPWRLHHKERVKRNQEKTHLLSTTDHEFFYTSSHLPLWSLRHVYLGREHVRFVLYTSHELWNDQVQFYKLLLGFDPEQFRDDFCLFTVQSETCNNFDVQFSLKRLPEGKRPFVLKQFHIQVKVKEIGQLVPLLPNICRPLNDVIWQTRDHDGNFVSLEVIRTQCQCANLPTACAKICNDQTLINIQQNQDDNIVGIHEGENQHFSVTYDIRSRFNHGKQTLSSVICPQENITRLHCDGESNVSNDFNIYNNLFLFSTTQQGQGSCVFDEDEESLTLTNTSEESGIQVLHDEGCDNESSKEIRPCLSKAGSKCRSSYLRVRFRDEIEAFDNYSISRLSSGFESDDQSDSDVQLPAIDPSNKCPGIDLSGDSPRGMTCSQHERPNIIDDRFGCKRRKDEITSRTDFPVHESAGPKARTSTLEQPVLKTQGFVSKYDVDLRNSNTSTRKENKPAPNNRLVFRRTPPSYEVATKRIAEFANRARSPSSPFPDLISFHKSIPFDKEIPKDKTNSATLPPSSCLQQYRRPDSPPHIVSYYPQGVSNQILCSSDSGGHNLTESSNMKCANSQQYFTSTTTQSRALPPHCFISNQNGSDLQLQIEDKFLNFNLRFDTFPALDGEPRPEQIGFFV